jgi:hypothetical protein
VVWAGAVMVGALLAIVDWRWIGRPVFAPVLAAGVLGGFIINKVSPFTFGVRDHFMEGVILAAGSVLALVGYVFAVICQSLPKKMPK